MDENKVKTDEPKVFLTRGDDGKLKAIAGEQNGKLLTVDTSAKRGISKKIIPTLLITWVNAFCDCLNFAS